MSQFALIYRRGTRELTATEMQEHLASCSQWLQELLAKGIIQDVGIPLGNGGSVVYSDQVFDGPFAEAKDSIVGLSIAHVASLAEAIEIAKTCPMALVGGSVEVRPVQGCAD